MTYFTIRSEHGDFGLFNSYERAAAKFSNDAEPYTIHRLTPEELEQVDPEEVEIANLVAAHESTRMSRTYTRFAVLVALVVLAVAAFLTWQALAPAPAPTGGELGEVAGPAAVLTFEDPATILTFEDAYLQALSRGGYSPNPTCFEDALKVSVWTGEEHGDAVCISLNDAIVTPARKDT